MKVFIIALASVLALGTAHAQAISGAYSGEYSSPQSTSGHSSKSISYPDTTQSSNSTNSGNVTTVSYVHSPKEFSLALIEKHADDVTVRTVGAPMTRYACEEEAKDLYKVVNDWAKYNNVMAVSCMKLGIAEGDTESHNYGADSNSKQQITQVTPFSFVALGKPTYSLIIMPSDHAGYEIPNFRSKANCEEARENIQTTVFTAHEQVLRCERK
jgi:hypothetical protein